MERRAEPARVSEDTTRLAVVEQRLTDLMHTVDMRLEASREAVALALAAAEKGIATALGTAEKAAAKAELAAGREYLEAQIEGLKQTITAMIVAQKEAVSAALISADKAVSKAELSAEKRFENVNEFRGALADQQLLLATKSEMNLRVNAIDNKIDESIKSRTAAIQALAERCSEISDRVRMIEGSANGSRAAMTTGFSILGAIIVIFGAVVALLTYLK